MLIFTLPRPLFALRAILKVKKELSKYASNQSATRGGFEIRRRLQNGSWNAMGMVVQGQQARPRHRRPHLHLGRSHARKWAITTSSRRARRPTRRFPLLPGPRLAGRLCPRLSEGRLTTAPQRIPPRTARSSRPLVLSASLANAGFLAVPHGLKGARAHQRHLSGALHALPGRIAGSFTVTARKIWAFLGDGETDETGIAGRHHARRRASGWTT